MSAPPLPPPLPPPGGGLPVTQATVSMVINLNRPLLRNKSTSYNLRFIPREHSTIISLRGSNSAGRLPITAAPLRFPKTSTVQEEVMWVCIT